MATTLADLIVWITADDSQLDKDLAGAEKKTQSAAGNMAKMFGGALVGAAAAAGGAIIGIGVAAFDVASDIDAATDQIGASLGLNSEKAKAFGQTIKDIYANNFGDSIADVGVAVENVAKQLKLTADDPALRTMTENAFRLRDVFGTDVADSIDAVKTLTEQFGITSEQAFDMLATGYQRGLDRSGDFLDTIGEYSVQFAEGGASAIEFFSALDTGLQGGMLGTDKAADAFKEFRVRIQDGSTLTADSLAMIGLSAEAITTGLASGAITVKDAWDMVQNGLRGATDSSVQFQAGVGLIGTQFEDLGAKVITGMDLTEDWAEGGLDSIANLDSKYTSLGSVIEGMWRQLQVGIAPAGEALLAFVHDNLPTIQGVVNTVSGAVVTAIELIPLAMMGLKRLWDEDWGHIRSTWETFAAELPKQQEEFWREWNQAFGSGSEENKMDWETWLGTLFSGLTRWVSTVIQFFTTFLGNWNNTTEAWHALTIGDWETFWGKIGDNFNSGFDVLFEAIEIFDVGFRDRLSGVVKGAIDNVKEMWDDFTDWWSSTFGGLLGGVGNLIPNLGFNQPNNAPNLSNQQIIDDIRGGASNFRLQGSALQDSNPTTVNQIQVNLANGGYESGFSAGEGILDAMRFRGV